MSKTVAGSKEVLLFVNKSKTGRISEFKKYQKILRFATMLDSFTKCSGSYSVAKNQGLKLWMLRNRDLHNMYSIYTLAPSIQFSLFWIITNEQFVLYFSHHEIFNFSKTTKVPLRIQVPLKTISPRPATLDNLAFDFVSIRFIVNFFIRMPGLQTI